jgi:hypothetical protein
VAGYRSFPGYRPVDPALEAERERAAQEMELALRRDYGQKATAPNYPPPGWWKGIQAPIPNPYAAQGLPDNAVRIGRNKAVQIIKDLVVGGGVVGLQIFRHDGLHWRLDSTVSMEPEEAIEVVDKIMDKVRDIRDGI